MRYISKYCELELYRNNGTKAHRFFNRELIVGDPTKSTGVGNAIDFSEQTDKKLSIQTIYPTDLAGATTVRAEMCGLGKLNPFTSQGILFESPLIAPGDTAVPATAGLVFRSYNGVVKYKGVEYPPNKIFITDGTITKVEGDSGSFIFLDLPLSQLHEGLDVQKALFADAHLDTGEESSSYYRYDLGGMRPQNKIGNAGDKTDTTISGVDGIGHMTGQG